MTNRNYAGLIAYLVLIIIAVALLLYAKQADAVDKPGHEVYVVQAGDTLWGIASNRYPGAHTGEMVHRIREINGTDGKLRSTVIHAGEELLLPVEVEGK
ncbi:MAG: LysM peptidoglycan-binding domain-containing protein [Clostridia bacterium]|nr:LysM peptidoglycan-binding domain-containing protein [Clostridia bacterium]